MHAAKAVSANPRLERFTRRVLDAASIRLDRAREIIVFGSRAAGIQSPNSDLDILYVGDIPLSRVKSPQLDLLWLRPEVVDSEKWRGSELAGHIAAYGRWLHGPGDWRTEVFSGALAVQRKQRQLEDRMQAFLASWDDLAPPYRYRLFTLIRRDLQRLELLCQGRPVPPTPLLESAWQKVEDPLAAVLRLLPHVTSIGEREKAGLASRVAEIFPTTPARV